MLTLPGRWSSYLPPCLAICRCLGLRPIWMMAVAGEMAKKHGFRLSGFRSFEREVTDEQIEKVRRNASKPGNARGA